MHPGPQASYSKPGIEAAVSCLHCSLRQSEGKANVPSTHSPLRFLVAKNEPSWARESVA